MLRHYLPSIAGICAFVVLLLIWPNGTETNLKADVTASCVQNLDNISHWWDADRDNGSLSLDRVADVQGFLQGAPSATRDTATKKVGAASFKFTDPTPNGVPGSSNNDGSFLKLPDNFLPYPTTGTSTTPFSFSLWFKTTSHGVILGQQSIDPFGAMFGWNPLIFVGTDGIINAEIWTDLSFALNGPATVLKSNRSVRDGIFHHFGVVYDGTKFEAFLDGASMGVKTNEKAAGFAGQYFYQLGTGSSLARFGGPGEGGWHSFTGNIDEFMVFSDALTSTEVQSIFNAGQLGVCKLECGNNIIQTEVTSSHPAEVCDGTALPSTASCASRGAGFTGAVTCKSDCSGLDESACLAPPVCSDGNDNDTDGKTDFPSDFGCSDANDSTEAPNPQCSDDGDNDGDGLTDFDGGDIGCADERDNNEENAKIPVVLRLEKGSPKLITRALLATDEILDLKPPTTCATCAVVTDPSDLTALVGGRAPANGGFVVKAALLDSSDNTISYTVVIVGNSAVPETRIFQADGKELLGFGDPAAGKRPLTMIAQNLDQFRLKIQNAGGLQTFPFQVTKLSSIVPNRPDQNINGEIYDYFLSHKDLQGVFHTLFVKGRHWDTTKLADINLTPEPFKTFFASKGTLAQCVQALQSFPKKSELVGNPTQFQLFLELFRLCTGGVVPATPPPATISNQVKINTFTFIASTADASVNSIGIAIGNGSPTLQNLKVKFNSSVWATQAVVSNGSTVTLSGQPPFVIPRGSSVNADIFADIVNPSSGVTPSATLSACSANAPASLSCTITNSNKTGTF